MAALPVRGSIWARESLDSRNSLYNIGKRGLDSSTTMNQSRSSRCRTAATLRYIDDSSAMTFCSEMALRLLPAPRQDCFINPRPEHGQSEMKTRDGKYRESR